MIATFAKAVALGLSVAASVGPIGILRVRRTAPGSARPSRGSARARPHHLT